MSAPPLRVAIVGGDGLIPAIGAYADRMKRLATEAGRDVVSLPLPDQVPADPAAIAAALAADPSITRRPATAATGSSVGSCPRCGPGGSATS